MENKTPKSKVGIIYLVWSAEPEQYLIDALQGVADQTYPKELIELIIIYNSHKPDEPSQAPYIRQQLEVFKDKLPHVTFLPQEKNLGFSGGNNEGIKAAMEIGCTYVFLHNADAYLGANCIEVMARALDEDKQIGTAQPLILLHPETDLINTAGNAFHFLGLGYSNLYRYDKKTVTLPKVLDVGYVSGAGTLMRVDLLKEYGLWDEDYFMYHEDTDYSLRLKYMGYRTVLISEAEFFHKYQFKKSIQKYYWMERNRYAILLIYFRWPTLLVLLPGIILSEIGLILFSIPGGWFKQRLEAYKYWTKVSNWKIWLKKRAYIQKNRKISDRQIFKDAVSGIHFQEAGFQGPLHKLANGGMWLYYWVIVRTLIWW
jgi:GT2 family glycosyltransferase